MVHYTPSMKVPALLRSFLISSGIDENWPLLQTVPPSLICVDVTGANTVGFTFVPYTAGWLVSAGTIDVQLIDIASPEIGNEAGIPVPEKIITSAPIQQNWQIGSGLSYDVMASQTITLRICKITDLDAAVFSLKIFWRVLS